MDDPLKVEKVEGDSPEALRLHPEPGSPRFIPRLGHRHEQRLAERIPLFRSLVEGAVEDFFLVPWLKTVEAKGKLLRSHFAQLRRREHVQVTKPRSVEDPTSAPP